MSTSKSRQSSNSSSSIWEPQAPYLQELYQAGSNLFGGQMRGARNAGNRVGQVINPALEGAVGNVGNIAAGTSADQEFLRSRMGQDNPYLDSVIGDAVGDISRGLTENILPALTTNAVGVGAYGGSRDAIARGLAGARAAEQMGQVSSDLRYADYVQDDQRAQALLNSQNTAGGLLPGMTDAAYRGAMSPYAGAWEPLRQYAGILGSPVVLANSASRGRSKGFGL